MVRKDRSVAAGGVSQLEASQRSEATSLRTELTDPRQLIAPVSEQLETRKILEGNADATLQTIGDKKDWEREEGATNQDIPGIGQQIIKVFEIGNKVKITKDELNATRGQHEHEIINLKKSNAISSRQVAPFDKLAPLSL